MDIEINHAEARVLGSMIEKELTTPDNYPLSLNAVKNACNQKSNRNPVVSYDDETIIQALYGLKESDLVFESHLSRVSKYEELLIKNHKFITREAAVLCILMLRGPQTLGEIRSRTERMYHFSELNEISRTLDSLAESGFIEKQTRKPGQKEDRYAHLLSGEEAVDESVSESVSNAPEVPESMDPERMEALELKVEELTETLNELANSFENFKKQFE